MYLPAFKQDLTEELVHNYNSRLESFSCLNPQICQWPSHGSSLTLKPGQ